MRGRKTEHVGDGLLSHEPELTLPSALAGLTAGFEMGPGVPPPHISPTNLTTPDFYVEVGLGLDQMQGIGSQARC